MPLVTLYRPENALIDYQNVKAASEFCGLDLKELVSLRLERLILHELLIRVTGTLTVPDGPNYEELGINLRGMVSTIYDHIEQHLPKLKAKFAAFEKEVEATLRAALAPALELPPPPPEEERTITNSGSHRGFSREVAQAGAGAACCGLQSSPS